MDGYTKKTMRWLDARYRVRDEAGIYIAHQPIYGFRKAHCEPGYLERYVRLYHILRALSRFKARTLLDVGCSEGFTCHLAQRLLGARPVGSDLSRVACGHCLTIFSLPACAADGQELPYRDNAFDLVLCSETLEHVSNAEKAVKELLRVSSRAVVITVPYEKENSHNQAFAGGHQHIHRFTPHSFDWLRAEGFTVSVTPLYASWTRRRAPMVEGTPLLVRGSGRYPGWVYTTYNRLVTALSRGMNSWSVSALILLDKLLCRLGRPAAGLLFAIHRSAPARSSMVLPRLLRAGVPFYRPT